MRVVIYCRRETDLAQLKQEGTQLYAYALQAGYQIDSMILDLDCGIWLERAGFYELLRQLQHNKGDAVLLNNMIALGSTISVQQRRLPCCRVIRCCWRIWILGLLCVIIRTIQFEIVLLHREVRQSYGA